MRVMTRCLSLIVFASILAVPVVPGASALSAAARTGAQDRRPDQPYRYYDRDHKDYHEWTEQEQRAYRHWLEERREAYRDYAKLARKRQQEYWNWRHEHPDWDRR